MNARIWSAACAAIGLGVSVGLLAQEAPAAQTPSQGAAAKTITVTGCVAKAEPGPTGTAGAAGAASEKATKFVLSGASMSPSATAGTAGAPATADRQRVPAGLGRREAHATCRAQGRDYRHCGAGERRD